MEERKNLPPSDLPDLVELREVRRAEGSKKWRLRKPVRKRKRQEQRRRLQRNQKASRRKNRG